MIYNFVGSNSDIGESIRLTRFGQAVELSDELAREALLGGCALVAAADFQEIGFTPKELETFSSPGSHERAPVEFIEKKRQALIAVHNLRARFEGAQL
jgi:hypothetical protein